MVAIAAGLALLDPAIVTVALPAIGEGLHADLAGLQWTMAAYAIGIVAPALLGEAIRDRYGHRRTLLAGLLAYALAAAGCAVAPTIEVFIAARLVQGAGAALVIPSASPAAPPSKWILAAGPIAGGLLVVTLSWRAIFAVVALAGIGALAAVAMRRTQAHRPAHTRLDVAGAALLTVGLSGVAAALTAAPRSGFGSFRVWLSAVVGLLGLVAFALVERRSRRPGVGNSDHEGRPRVIALLPAGSLPALMSYTFLVYAALGGLVFFLLIELQTVAGYTALGAGSAVLPVTAIVVGFAARSAAYAARIGPQRQLVLGPLLATLGTVLLSRIGPEAIYWRDVLPGTVVVGCGLAVFLPPLAWAVRSAYPVQLAAARTGQLLAVAGLPMVAGLAGAAYANPAAFHHGFRVALEWCAGLFLAGALTVLVRRTSTGPSRWRISG